MGRRPFPSSYHTLPPKNPEPCCRRTRSSRLDALGAACFKNAKQNTKHQKHQTAPPLKYETSITMFFILPPPGHYVT